MKKTISKQTATQKKGGSCLNKLLFVALAILAIAVGLKYSGVFGEGDGKGPGQDDIKIIAPQEVTKATPENSPDNPQFIDVRFTEDEYRKSPAVTGVISVDTSAVVFSEQGVTVDVRGYNLHNPKDTLVVKTLPVKTDPTYGHELHTYNVSLTSGQDKFGTEVEVTLPIHNGSGALQNVLWLNHDTGKWEEVFYTVADDGKSCTAYVDHFSDFATEELSQEQLEKSYNDMRNDLVGANNTRNDLKGSIFVEYDPTGSAPQAMKRVSIIPTNEFEEFMSKTSKNSETIYKILCQGGGIPTGSETIEALDMLSIGGDLSSSIVTVTNSMKILSDGLSNTLSPAFTMLGWWILDQREKDMTMRGISPEKVEEENRWSHYLAKVSTVGTATSLLGSLLGKTAAGAAAAAGLSTGAAICSWACLLGFGATTVYTINQKFISKECPYGIPMSIEDGAYHEYFLFDNIGPLKKLGINSNVPLNGLGKGWAEAINAIRDANPDAKSIDDVGEQIKQLYEEYVNYFWTDAPDEQKLIVWRTYLQKATLDVCQYCNDLYAKIPILDTGDYLLNKVPHLPSDKEEYERLFKLCQQAGMIVLNTNGKLVPTRTVICESDFLPVSSEARFNATYIRGQTKEYKHRATEALMRQTKKIILDLIKKDFHKRALDVRDKIRNEVLPTMNSTLHFYAVDESLKKDETVLHSKYYGYDAESRKNDPKLLCKMEFKGRRDPLFRAKNDTGAKYCLDLKTSIKEEKVGECTVFHYLQYGTPDSVEVTPAADSKLSVTYGRVDFKEKQAYETNVRNCRGYRIPVKFNKKHELNIFSGAWVPMELMGKYTPSQKILGLVYLEKDNEFGEYEGPGSAFETAKNRWLEIKHFDFNEKTGVLTIDFAKNNPEKAQGTATFYVDKDDCLVMKNSGGTFRFFRWTEENKKKNDELYKKEQERKARERENKKEQTKGDKKKYSIIPPGDTSD